MELCIFSVMASPYQRDLFRALAAVPGVSLRVYYCSASAPDSPWPQEPPEAWEHLLPGICVGRGNVRVKFNHSLPKPRTGEQVILNLDLTSATTQWLMRRLPRGTWIFWGERMRAQPPGWRRRAATLLAAPLKNAGRIVAIGRAAARDYAERFPGVPVASIPYHCDLSAFLALPQRSAAPVEGLTFLFCGQMIRRKGLDLLLEAFAILVEEGAPVRLRLVGREAELPELWRHLSPAARARIAYAGFKAPAELHHAFAGADVFILPSRHEGWGVVVNQALAAGLPVLCSESVGASELVEPGVNGLVFATGQVAALYRAMRRMVDQPERLAPMAAAARRKAAELTPEKGACKWLELLGHRA